MVSEENKHIYAKMELGELMKCGVVLKGITKDVYRYSEGWDRIQRFRNKIERFKFKNLNYEPAMCHCRKKANIILCCIRQSIVYSLRELVVPLCSSLEGTQNQMDTVLSSLLSQTHL